MDKTLPLEERFRAQLKLAAAAAQLGHDPHPQPLRGHRPSARLLSQAEDVPHRAARTGLARRRSPASSSRAGKEDTTMSLTDPLGDMLTRIRNAHGRKKSKVSTPASKLRARVLDVLKSEGYIRGYSADRLRQRQVRVRDRAEVFRRRAGHPRDRPRLEARPPRLRLGQVDPAASPTASASSILSTPKGVMADHEAREQNVGGEILCQIF